MTWLQRFRRPARTQRVLPRFPAHGILVRPREFFLAIFHANRLDLTLRAISSVEPWWKDTVVIDNSDDDRLRDHWVANVVTVVTPIVPLTFSQSMEACRLEAITKQHPWYAVMHNDAEVSDPATLSELAAQTRSAVVDLNRRVGGLFTNYDALVCFNTGAAHFVGPWDTNIPQYGAETDYYHRMRSAGFHFENAVNVPVLHGVSQTIKSDSRRKWYHEAMNNEMMNYYRKKWSGGPGQERYTQPWNGEVPQ